MFQMLELKGSILCHFKKAGIRFTDACFFFTEKRSLYGFDLFL